MRRYEMVREILNACPGNQMRDVFISEVETDDQEAYVRSMAPGAEVIREDMSDGDTVFHTDRAGFVQKFTFTPDD